MTMQLPGRSLALWVLGAGSIFILLTYVWTTDVFTIRPPQLQTTKLIYYHNDTVTSLANPEKPTSSRAFPLVGPKLFGKNMLTNRMTDDYTYCKRILPFMGPFNFTAQSKNPCWWDDNGEFRCIPYFYLAGFSKCGTTDLFVRILMHPSILKQHKESHWIDYLRYYDNFRFVENFTDVFAPPSIMIHKKIRSEGHSDLVFGDGTPTYAWFSLYWHCFEGNEGLSEPHYTNADLLHRLNPNAKIIILLRDPAARLYSRFLTWVYMGPHAAYQQPSPESFHELVVQAVAKYTECFKQYSPRHCAYDGELYTQAALRLQEGMYSVFLKDWFKVFPRNQILVLRFEDYIENTKMYIEKVFTFLELDPVSSRMKKMILKLRPKNPGKHYSIGPMLNRTRAVLEKFYHPFVLELPDLLLDKTFLWHYDKT